MTSNYGIRRAHLEDANALGCLRWDSSDERPREDKQTFIGRFEAFWRAALDDGRWAVFVADRDGVIVSNMWVYLVPKVPRPYEQAHAYGYLTNVYTDPGARNAGVGAAVLEHVIEWAKVERLEALFVSPSDESVRFYERAGFSWSEQWMELEFRE